MFPLCILFKDVVVTSCGLMRKEKLYFHFHSINLGRGVTGECSKRTEVEAYLFESLVVLWFFCFIWACNFPQIFYFVMCKSQMLLLWLSS
jgi:hypothetical protein